MAKHTEVEMEKLPFDELKKHAAEEAAAPPEPVAKAAAVVIPEEEAEEFVARRELDLGEGAGVEVFEATGDSREAALEALTDKIADAKLNASKKIRAQELELKDFRSRTAEPPKPKEISADDEYIYAQELGTKPTVAFKKMFKELTGYDIEDFASMKQATDALNASKQTNEAINTFIATHPDYEDGGDAGKRNGDLMRMKLRDLGLAATSSENFSKAYSSLKQSGLLELKGEEAHSDAEGEIVEKERIVPAKVEPTQQRTKKVSGITTHNRTVAVPVNTEPSEADAYKMPLDQLRQLANQQLAKPR